MPRSLRWLSAVSTAVVSLFVYSVLTLGIAKATGAAKATGTAQVHGAVRLLVSLGGLVVPLIVALAVNDWLRERYGLPAKREADERVPSARA